MRFVITVFCIGALSTSASAQTPKVIINEVLANEPGAFTSLEWIELYNADLNAVPLADFSIIEGADTSRLDSGSVVLPAGGFAIVSRKPLAETETENSFEKHWGNNSGFWGDDSTENYPLLKAKFSLSNSSSRVLLLYQGTLVDSFKWTSDAGDGKSWERISATTPATSGNLAVSSAASGSTPGKINSVAPVARDLAFDEVMIQNLPLLIERFIADVVIKNIGTDTTISGSATVFLGIPGDTSFNTVRQLDLRGIPPLGPGEKYNFQIDLFLPKGYQRVILSLSPDDRNENNFFGVNLRLGTTAPTLLINEFLPDPENPLESEWIELYNAADTTVQLFGWKIGDAKSQVQISIDSISVSPGNFVVVVQNKVSFQSFYPNITAQVFQPTSWPSLNNDGDTIKLVSPFGLVEDSVGFNKGYGANVSWEKKDPALPSDNPANWWRSVDAKGATPGGPNSIAAAYSDNLQVDISPNPFSPDGDGFDDEVSINFTLPFQANLTVRIYDVNGREVKTLLDNSPAVYGKITWDGKGNNGKTLRSGIYVLFMETSGSARLTKKGTLVLVKKK